MDIDTGKEGISGLEQVTITDLWIPNFFDPKMICHLICMVEKRALQNLQSLDAGLWA